MFLITALVYECYIHIVWNLPRKFPYRMSTVSSDAHGQSNLKFDFNIVLLGCLLRFVHSTTDHSSGGRRRVSVSRSILTN